MQKPKLTAGIPSLNRPTPPMLKRAFTGILFVSGFYAIVVSPNLKLEPAVEAIINKWIVIALSGMRFTIMFFGFKYDETKPLDQ